VLGGGGIRHGRTPGGLGHDGRAAAMFLRRGAPWMRPPHQVGGAPLLTEDTRSPAEDVSEVLVCYSLGVYETQSNPQATRVIV
jgi:hypothetical protein